MKKHIITIVAITMMIVGPLAAQDDTEPHYLFDLKSVKLSGFGSTLTEFSFTGGDFAVSQGGGGALLFNYSCYFGFYGLSLATNQLHADIYPADHDPVNNPRLPRYTDFRLSFENSGVWFGFINNYKNMVHWGANMKIGRGTIALYDANLGTDYKDLYFKDNVFVASPEIECEVNLTRWFKVNAGVGYRFVAGVGSQTYTNVNGDEIPLYKSSQFNSPFATVKLMFGCFAKRNRNHINTNN